MEAHERVWGCLLGGAIGDALGAPVEFWSSTEIASRVGPSGVRNYLPVAYGTTSGLGLITDDTQMTLFTIEGLLRTWVDDVSMPPQRTVENIHQAYLNWLDTQEQSGPSAVAHVVDRYSWLAQEQWLYSQRAPGLTCLSALLAADRGELGLPSANTSKGCGGVMRSAPFGLLPMPDPAGLAMACSALTHGHPTGQHPSGALAIMIVALLDDANLREAVDAALDWLHTVPGSLETVTALEAAVALAATPPESIHAAQALGGGWIAEEALAIGVYAALVHPQAEETLDALALAVSHSGDSDSTGSICGSLVGALHGHHALPPDLADGLEGRLTIAECARDLSAARELSTVRASRETPTIETNWMGKYR